MWIDKWLEEARPKLAKDPDPGFVFLSNHGNPLDHQFFSYMVKKHMRAADLGDSGSCHVFRHSMATLMLDNGADIRCIQEILGHSDLSTTQRYTKVSLNRIKQVHKLTHPAKIPSSQSKEERSEV